MLTRTQQPSVVQKTQSSIPSKEGDTQLACPLLNRQMAPFYGIYRDRDIGRFPMSASL